MHALAPRLSALLLVMAGLMVALAPAHAARASDITDVRRFVTTWDTTVDPIIDLHLYGTVDVTIEWGDGAVQGVHTTRVRGTDGPISHEFTDGAATHQVTVTGTFTALGSPAPPLWQDLPIGLLTVDEFMLTGTTDMASAFDGASRLTYVAQMPFGVTDVSRAFAGTRVFNQQLGSWSRELATATDMSEMFMGSRFDQPIDTWDVSHVTDMSGMFRNSLFNQPIGGWDVSHVTDMTGMFEQAQTFDVDLSHWCVPTIPTRPTAFDDGAARWSKPRPPWGTCGADALAPTGTYTFVGGARGAIKLEGNASDQRGVRNVAVAIRSSATGQWLQPDGTWGAFRRLYTVVAAKGAATTGWKTRRVVPPGTYGVTLVVIDTSGNVNVKPRPWRRVTVT